MSQTIGAAAHMAPGRYTATARALHWVTAALILAAVLLGLWIGFALPQDEAAKLRLFAVHENLGFTVLVLTLLRLAWRSGHPAPPLPADLPDGLKLAAHGTHAALYALLIAQPVIGLLATNAWGFPFSYLGVVPIPSPIGRSEAWAPTLSTLHGLVALALVGLVCLHAGAALWHQFVRRDGTLSRML